MTPLTIFCAGTSWDGVPGSDRHLATALCRYSQVLWVDPPVSLLTPARFRGSAGRRLVPRLAELDAGLLRLTPTAAPGWTRQGVRWTTWPLVRAQLRWALRRLGQRPHAVVACSLDDVLTGWPSGVRTVLYGTDDYVAGAQLMGQGVPRLVREERRQLRRADLVVAVSPVLRDRWADRGARAVAVLPNGCDVAAFADVDSAPRPAAVPPGRPVVGLVGQLSERIDLDLLDAVAALDCTLLVVGPRRPSWEPARFAALAARPNVVYVGPVPAADLPAYLGAMDVGITPYQSSAFNRASFPLKTLEYLAAGRAVVSTDLPATRWLGTDLVATAVGPAEFAAAVLAALPTARDAGLMDKRRVFAAEHSWQRRAAELATLLGLTGSGQTGSGQTGSTPTEPSEESR
ncbi:MAG TPA: glycosyltransferase [Mycobacteriales bacterium]|nr:glycosyltransferase [Mycobacteriales bacterium]